MAMPGLIEAPAQIWLAVASVDMRRGINGLSSIVQNNWPLLSLVSLSPKGLTGTKGVGNYKCTNLSSITLGAALAAMY
jgi:hypothetical protein